ncbi:MAG: helix-turn-helix transcriptional regulator [Bradymonadaceae bacterium]
MNDLTHLFSESQQRLLELLKRREEVSVDDAVEALDLAETTVRQHFDALDDEGLVVRESRAEGRGRPRQYFRLSVAARQLFPSRDGDMLAELIGFLAREGYHRAIDEFFQEFWEGRRRSLRERLEANGAESFEEKLEVLRAFLDDQGFMPDVRVGDDGTVVIRECNCPLEGAVEATKLPCRLEADFLEKVIGETLSRVEYIPDGEPACRYEFERSDQ